MLKYNSKYNLNRGNLQIVSEEGESVIKSSKKVEDCNVKKDIVQEDEDE
jgi:hypothetical protein